MQNVRVLSGAALWAALFLLPVGLCTQTCGGGKVEDGNFGGPHHLWVIKETFIKLCKCLDLVDLIAAGVSGQAMLLEALVDEARTSLRIVVLLRKDVQGPDGQGG
jgi:hypothetical protein